MSDMYCLKGGFSWSSEIDGECPNHGLHDRWGNKRTSGAFCGEEGPEDKEGVPFLGCCSIPKVELEDPDSECPHPSASIDGRSWWCPDCDAFCQVHSTTHAHFQGLSNREVNEIMKQVIATGALMPNSIKARLKERE